jgi:hypothetical protein
MLYRTHYWVLTLMFLNVSYLKMIWCCTELTVQLSMVRSYRGSDSLLWQGRFQIKGEALESCEREWSSGFLNHDSKISYIITCILSNRDRFAGGMKLVSLHSIVQNKLVRRNLNDKNFTVVSSGVAFDECLGQVSSVINRNNCS